MGYTHYFENMTDLHALSDTAMAQLEKIFLLYGSLVQYENDDNKAAVVKKDHIRFNGINDEGHETFLWRPVKHFFFCKTAQKEYDIVVCLVILTLKQEYGRAFQLMSDGDEKDWKLAFETFQRLFSIRPDSSWFSQYE